MANLKHAIKQGIVALKAKNIQPVMQTVGDECLLKGKTALVVGGSGGIGKAVAKAFLKNGANVVIAGTRRAKVDKVVLELGEKCARGCCRPCRAQRPFRKSSTRRWHSTAPSIS